VYFFGRPHEIKNLTEQVFLVCALGTMVFGGIIRVLSQVYEIGRAKGPLVPPQMAFSLSYEIANELEHFERNRMEIHRRKIINLWTRQLTYLRWIFDSQMTPDSASFHRLPDRYFLVALNAQRVAEALNRACVEKPAYAVITGLNTLHYKVTPRLLAGSDSQTLIPIFRQLGNFLYTFIPEHRKNEEMVFWGYSELKKCIDGLNALRGVEVTAEQTAGDRARAFLTLCSGAFNHSHIAVAFIAWWVVSQALFAISTIIVFHYFPSLIMNAQAMVALIAASVAAAISMVGLSRKSS
jgi:hypothetical protein